MRLSLRCVRAIVATVAKAATLEARIKKLETAVKNPTRPSRREVSVVTKQEAMTMISDELADMVEYVLTRELLDMLANGATEDECLIYLEQVRAPQIKDWMKHQVRRMSYELDGTTLH